MIRRSADRPVNVKSSMHGGIGDILITAMLSGPDEMYGKGRLFSTIRLEPGNSIGWHVHENEEEAYYILCGEGELDDNGTLFKVFPGDVALTLAGEGHAIKNVGSGPLELVALILYK